MPHRTTIPLEGAKVAIREIVRGGAVYSWSMAGSVVIVREPNGGTVRRRLGGSKPEAIAEFLVGQIQRKRKKQERATGEAMAPNASA